MNCMLCLRVQFSAGLIFLLSNDDERNLSPLNSVDMNHKGRNKIHLISNDEPANERERERAGSLPSHSGHCQNKLGLRYISAPSNNRLFVISIGLANHSNNWNNTLKPPSVCSELFDHTFPLLSPSCVMQRVSPQWEWERTRGIIGHWNWNWNWLSVLDNNLLICVCQLELAIIMANLSSCECKSLPFPSQVNQMTSATNTHCANNPH